MIACTDVQRLLPLLYDGELDSPLRRQLNQHVANCPTCARGVMWLDCGQELLRQTIDDHIDELDFSHFWKGVEEKLARQPAPWWQRLPRWGESWRSTWSWQTPVWAAATVVLVLGSTFFWASPPPPEPVAKSPIIEEEPTHIESPSSIEPVFVWSEPTYNATVIWVDGEESEEEWQ